ncbi:MAG: oxidoreductase [Tardiphaga sp.]|uniref:SDR family oxidoreductase n=1 Tax=Tardiphaga sp. TaxID=1926292 RepID=UPI0026044083|nr:SDR family oxidoreductase [Tardiphaga sp.]MDB5502974.1 oxidoreductase [Tardiphaga sp.]
MTNPPSAVRKVILIMGASSGIGEATALHLATKGHRIAIGARRTDRIAAIAREIEWLGGDVLHQALDVTDVDSVKAFAAAALARYGRIDVLVNNASAMPLSPMAELRIDDWNRMIDVNLRGVLHGIAAVLPIMQAQGAGHFINVASTAAHRVDPAAAVYCATKHAVRALSEGLRQQNKNLRVTVISSGITQTEPFDGIGGPGLKGAAGAMIEQASIPASAIAEAIGYAIGQPDAVDVNELIVRATAQR